MKRSSYLQYDAEHQLSGKSVIVWGYDKKKRYVCRLEINGAGLALYTGSKGRTLVADVSWEKLVERLKKK